MRCARGRVGKRRALIGAHIGTGGPGDRALAPAGPKGQRQQTARVHVSRKTRPKRQAALPNTSASLAALFCMCCPNGAAWACLASRPRSIGRSRDRRQKIREATARTAVAVGLLTVAVTAGGFDTADGRARDATMCRDARGVMAECGKRRAERRLLSRLVWELVLWHWSCRHGSPRSNGWLRVELKYHGR